MEKQFMLMVTKNRYCENCHIAQSNLEIQCYPHQATYDPLHRTRKNKKQKNLKFHMESKESPHSSDNPQQKEQSWKYHAT